MPPTVTLLSDFGLRDEFAGVMEGVIVGIAPAARVIHVTHGIPPQSVLKGALALEQALPYLPVGVHVAVVDPGVGSARRAVVVRTTDERLLVGPDNGLLIPAAERVGGIAGAHAIANERLLRHPVSATFHGRDVFAPVAAHLAGGSPLADVGPAIDPASLERVPIPQPVVGDGQLGGVALAIDRFGNVALNARAADLDAAGIEVGATVEVTTGGSHVLATRARTFADVRVGEIVVYENSSGRAGIALSSGSFVAVCGLDEGDAVLLRGR